MLLPEIEASPALVATGITESNTLMFLPKLFLIVSIVLLARFVFESSKVIATPATVRLLLILRCTLLIV